MEKQMEHLVTQEWEKYRHPNTPVPNILLLGAADSGKEAFAKQVFGREFTKTWDIGFRTVEPLPAGDPLGIRLIDSHGFEQLDGNSKSVADYCKALDLVLEQNRETGDPNKKIHAVWYCISPTSEKMFQQELTILWKICTEQSLQDKLAVVVLQDDAARKSRPRTDLITSLREAIRGKPHDSTIAFSVCNGPDLAPDGERLIKWTADQMKDEEIKTAFITSQVVSYQAKKKIADACRASLMMPSGISPNAHPLGSLENQKGVATLAKAIQVYNLEKYITPEEVVDLVEWNAKQTGVLLPPLAMPAPGKEAMPVDVVSELARNVWERRRKDKDADVSLLFSAGLIKQRVMELQTRSHLLG